MSLCVLFGLLFCCLACFREGVWTKYTPQDVARWHAKTAQQTPDVPVAAARAQPRQRVGPARTGKVANRPLTPEPIEEIELVA